MWDSASRSTLVGWLGFEGVPGLHEGTSSIATPLDYYWPLRRFATCNGIAKDLFSVADCKHLLVLLEVLVFGNKK